jgi:hypothetical protein
MRIFIQQKTRHGNTNMHSSGAIWTTILEIVLFGLLISEDLISLGNQDEFGSRLVVIQVLVGMVLQSQLSQDKEIITCKHVLSLAAHPKLIFLESHKGRNFLCLS